ncbi:hypothetical protein ATPR_0422 [Acetobacter tropicalis NBRC 101654]|uniref:Uncharacterized protein n=1 Tax=Acetobacter tropicalis NBRC 101654 TaxID=749388 RepID=F7VAM3_9PROT|nr:hypothetical protein ATPR_0422 [Acetobacter tropicalis NBRC 101654]
MKNLSCGSAGLLAPNRHLPIFQTAPQEVVPLFRAFVTFCSSSLRMVPLA